MADQVQSDYTLYIDNSLESREAIAVLRASGIKVNIERPDRSVTPDMVVPYLVTVLDYGYVGLERIRFFILIEPHIREYTEESRKRVGELYPKGQFMAKDELEEVALMREIVKVAKTVLNKTLGGPVPFDIFNDCVNLGIAFKHYDEFMEVRGKSREQEPSQSGLRQYHGEFTLSSLTKQG